MPKSSTPRRTRRGVFFLFVVRVLLMTAPTRNVYALSVTNTDPHHGNISTTPIIDVVIVEGPVSPMSNIDTDQRATPTPRHQTGAILTFLGTVRATEGDHHAPIAALHYEAYEPMAQRELHAIAAAAIERHGLHSVRLVHSKGHVAVGEASILVEVRSRHRAEGLKAMAEMLDGLKERVPIWKSPLVS